MRIRLTRYGRREIVAGTVAFAGGLVASAWLFWPACVAVVILWLGFLAFFRDPERHVQASPDQLLSPADGTVADVQEVAAPAPFLEGKATRIGIFMSLLDCHVNRSPVDGTVRYAKHTPGAFHDARRPVAARENEHTLIGIELDGGRRIMVNQIAGAVARRIVCQAQTGSKMRAGQRYGMVKFGSRVELFVPSEDQIDVTVQPGDKVKAGLDVVALYLSDSPSGGTRPAAHGPD